MYPIDVSKYKPLGSTWRNAWRPWIKPSEEAIARKKFHVVFFNKNKQNYCKKSEIIHRPLQELVQREHIIVEPTPQTRYDYIHTPFDAYKALSTDAIVPLEIPTWTRPVYPNLVRMTPH